MADDRDRADRVEFVRRLVLARCPELSMADLEVAFGNGDSDRFDDVLVQIADTVGETIQELEQRLDRLERGLPWRVH